MCLGYRSQVKTDVHKMMPSKPALGGSDDHLEPPRLIFGSPLGSPIGDKIEKNEALQHMSEPSGSQDGPKVAPSRPKAQNSFKMVPQIDDFLSPFVYFVL